MNGEKKDLRYSRTDRLLQEAFLELLKVKSVNRISIRDLTERAGINRCTFYHHYQDIYDLLEQIEDGVHGARAGNDAGLPSEPGRGCQPPLF